ncbi:MAG: hypothetical protein ACREBD_04010 [Blastocatellia bacterium]
MPCPDAPFADQFEGDPQSWNLYAFVRNNPCANTDPSGRNTCYYSNGSLIGCQGDPKIKVDTKAETLTLTQKGHAPIVYDLNKVDAQFITRAGAPTVQDFIFEMDRRAEGTQGLIGYSLTPYAVGGLVATGGAALGAGGIGFGTTVTTIGLRAVPFAGAAAGVLSRLGRGDQRIFELARQAGMSATKTFQQNFDALLKGMETYKPGANLQMNPIGTIQGATIWGSNTTGIGIAEINNVTVIVATRGLSSPQILGPLPW